MQGRDDRDFQKNSYYMHDYSDDQNLSEYFEIPLMTKIWRIRHIVLIGITNRGF